MIQDSIEVAIKNFVIPHSETFWYFLHKTLRFTFVLKFYAKLPRFSVTESPTRPKKKKGKTWVQRVINKEESREEKEDEYNIRYLTRTINQQYKFSTKVK